MTVGERILKIIERQNLKKVEFAKKLNIDQSYVTRILGGDRAPSKRLIEDICRKFGINEEWLENGTGNMYQEQVDDLWNAPDVDDLDRKILTSYLKMTPDKRKFIKEWIKELAASFSETEQSQPKREPVPDEELSREEKHRLLDEELDKAEKRRMLSASTITNGLSNRVNKT